ncbi:peptide/nickel transport system permease protein [Rhizobiales bacterium GAS191]|jgi:peptide/nickel transport system permease protein|nr:peptide/nickel transport system permease protein [Rhizobiales bacterium GAS113]SEC44931.1 peptide/nickel transport system permease protein [Rhizobiales bacterium GAS191]SEC81289.1 peptide/nickel transport system permease protein [Rhizobiales bacterium GAS188]
MIAFVIRRLFASIGVLIAVGLIAFVLFRYVGDPVNQMVGIETPESERAALRQQLGLNDFAVVQALRFLGNAARLDFGISYQFKQPVSDMIGARMPATLELAFVASIMSLLAGIPMGVYTALRRKSALAKAFEALSLVGISLPTFLIGILLIYLFAVTLGWLPSFGRGDVVKIGWWTTGLLTVSGLKAIIMPAITLALFQMTLIMRLVRAEMLEVLRADYIRFARARGLSDRSVYFRHALKNTLVPVITVVGLQLGSIVAFSIITETVFAWPGMGQLFLQSVQNVDVPIMAAYLLFIALLFVIINLVVDLLYAAVDPRLRVAIQGG